MNKKLQPTLIALSLIATFGASATVYKIENIDSNFFVNGTIDGSRSGFGTVLNKSGNQLGGASGRFALKLTTEQEQAIINSRVDIVLAQQSTEATVTNRIAKNVPSASNFIFNFDQNVKPTFIKVLNETITDLVSVQTYAFGLNENSLIVGTTSSAAEKISDPDQSDGNTTKSDPYYGYDFAQRAMLIDNGEVKVFAPEFSTYGGQSGFTATNDGNLLVGYASVGIIPASQTLITDRCFGTYKDKVPLKVCTGGFSHSSMSNPAAAFYLHAFSWQYSDGQPTNPTDLGILASKVNDDDNTMYSSIALGLNASGVIVGRSTAFRNNEKETIKKFNVAVIFKDGEIIDLMDHNNKDWYHSTAVDISDDNLVIGTVQKNFSGYRRTKFFVYDATGVTTETKVELEFPTDFKSSETDFSSQAKAINSAHMVVGNIEIDAVKSENVTRRTHGFVYDHANTKFSDINNLLTCHSLGFIENSDGSIAKHKFEISGENGETVTYEAGITIVDATDISDDGSIMATALVRLPKVKTKWVDSDGNDTTSDKEGATEVIVVDANGKAVFSVDGNGKPVTEQLPRAVVLRPTTGEACDISGQGIVEDKHVRQGAGFGWAMLVLSVFGFGRQRLKRN